MNDANKIRHDLAVAYASNKLMLAMQRGELVQQPNIDEPVAAAQSMAAWYRLCMNELLQIKDSHLCDAQLFD